MFWTRAIELVISQISKSLMIRIYKPVQLEIVRFII